MNKWARLSSLIQCKPHSLFLSCMLWLCLSCQSKYFYSLWCHAELACLFYDSDTSICSDNAQILQHKNKTFSLFWLNLAGQVSVSIGSWRSQRSLVMKQQNDLTLLTAYLANCSLQNGIKPPLWCVPVSRNHLLLHFFIETVNLVRKR